MSPKEVLEFAKQKEARQFDLRFTDLPGLQQHVSYPIAELEEDSFEDGFGIDGSSIRGWAAINESDMLLIPDPTTAFIDPFYEIPTLVIVCDVVDQQPVWLYMTVPIRLPVSCQGMRSVSWFERFPHLQLLHHGL